jgi:ubiquinone/menaquinone biosynthesis C-methylase UbiE
MSSLSRVLEPEAMDSLEEAISYDQMNHSEVNTRFVLDLLAVHPHPKRALDLGTGTAQIPICFCAHTPDATITGVDLAPAMLRHGAMNVAKANLTSRISLVVCDVGDVPYEPGLYDVVMSNSLAHHVPDPMKFFGAIARVAQGATVFLRDLCRPNTLDELHHIVKTYAGDEADYARELFRASLHAALTVNEVTGAAKAAGLLGVTVTQSSDRHWTLIART